MSYRYPPGDPLMVNTWLNEHDSRIISANETRHDYIIKLWGKRIIMK